MVKGMNVDAGKWPTTHGDDEGEVVNVAALLGASA